MMNRVLLVVILLALTSCGFALRSYDFSSAVDSYALVGRTQLGIAQPLRTALRQAGLEEAPTAEAAIVVELLDQRRDRRSISTSGRAQAAEYETSYGVQYRLLDAAGLELAPVTWIERERVFRIDQGNIVGSSEEQALLERELMNDVVGQIIRAMNAVSRNATDAS